MFRLAPRRRVLMPGTVFIYRGPREGLFGPRRYAIGEVLALDESAGIVHVRTLRGRGREGKSPVVQIGHIPVLQRHLVRDLVEIVGRARPDVDSWATVNAFRRRFARGEVGAFAGRLWKAEWLARRALPPEQAREPIRHTFVRRMAEGASGRRRAPLEIEVEVAA